MYHYKTCGLPDVWLVNGYKQEETPYGPATSIENIEGLNDAIGALLIEKPNLTGAEFRFLRKELEMSQSNLGNILSVSAQQIARYEKDKPSRQADRFVRVLYNEHKNKTSPVRKLIEHINQLDIEINERRICLEETDSGWVAKLAA